MRTPDEILAELKLHADKVAALHAEFQAVTNGNSEVDALVALAAQAYCVSPGAIRSRSRMGKVSAARQAVFAALTERSWRHDQIGAEFRRDRGTVTHGVNNHFYQVAVKPVAKEINDRFKRLIAGMTNQQAA